jgi:enamine deaminase RidA (YjgF/YER057c/UK114 family)
VAGDRAPTQSRVDVCRLGWQDRPHGAPTSGAPWTFSTDDRLSNLHERERRQDMSITRHGPGPRMSAAVVHGDTVYLAGQVSGDSDTMKGQTEQVLKKIDGLLASAGTSKSKLLSATIYITDMRLFNDMNAVWDAWVDPQNTPARATVQAALANPKLLVEISIVAGI